MSASPSTLRHGRPTAINRGSVMKPWFVGLLFIALAGAAWPGAAAAAQEAGPKTDTQLSVFLDGSALRVEYAGPIEALEPLVNARAGSVVLQSFDRAVARLSDGAALLSPQGEGACALVDETPGLIDATGLPDTFVAQYLFHCEDPDAVTGIAFTGFLIGSGPMRIDAIAFGDGREASGVLTPDAPVLAWR